MREDLDRLTTGRHISRGILNMFDGNKCICVTELYVLVDPNSSFEP